MRIEQLEYLAAVTEHGSLRRASEHLHISQPALSESLAKLERELGVTLLDRRRSGARISAQGRDLLHHMVEVLEAVGRLRAAAGDRAAALRTVRLGTVDAGTSTVLLPGLTRFRGTHPGTSVEIRNLQQEEIHLALSEGGLDLGLVNLLDGDDLPPDLDAVPLAHGRAVAVLPAGHPLARQASVSAAQLREAPFIGMRAGYLMHRFAHRLFHGDLPREWHSTDGAEMGKLLVAEGLGLTLLPDFSVVGDPAEQEGRIVSRPLSGDATRVTMAVVRRRRGRLPAAAAELVATLQGVARERTAPPRVRAV